MIKIENVDVYGWEAAIRGARNPMNSWDKEDTKYFDACGVFRVPELGPNDLRLLRNLANAGPDHGKFLRMITVSLDITAPLYWYKEFDTYKVGTVANSCSTMHKIHAKEFTLEDFSFDEDLMEEEIIYDLNDPGDEYSLVDHTHFEICVHSVIDVCECLRKMYNHYMKMAGNSELTESERKHYARAAKKSWRMLIQYLPTSYNQRRTVLLNYQVLKSMYHARKNHKLDEWRKFCSWIETLPYSELIIGGQND